MQDDSRGHFHYVVNDPAVLLAPAPAPSPTSFSSVTLACEAAGGQPAQCGCIEQALRAAGGGADLARAAASYATRGRLPEDLAAEADRCRTGA